MRVYVYAYVRSFIHLGTTQPRILLVCLADLHARNFILHSTFFTHQILKKTQENIPNVIKNTNK